MIEAKCCTGSLCKREQYYQVYGDLTTSLYTATYKELARVTLHYLFLPKFQDQGSCAEGCGERSISNTTHYRMWKYAYEIC
jgi:hypothetical protein